MVNSEIMMDKSADDLADNLESVNLSSPAPVPRIQKPAKYKPSSSSSSSKFKKRQSSSSSSSASIEFVRGNCTTFCPLKEVEERTHHGLLHYYEWKDGQKHKPGTVVKEFVRPAAGKLRMKPEELRTPKCLIDTIDYLFNVILLDERKPFHFVYDFIFDRLRAIRQDIIIQNLPLKDTIMLFEPIIMFLAYSRYRLTETPIMEFDPKICEHHLHECVNKTLTCYDSIESLDDLPSLQRRAIIESIYLILNLGKQESLQRYINKLPMELKSIDFLTAVYRMSLQFMLGNYYRTNCIMIGLPHILCTLASLHLPIIRKNILRMLSVAYSSQNNRIQLAFIRHFTIHANDDDLRNELTQYKLQVIQDQHQDKDKGYWVQFQKNQFDYEISTPAPRKERFVDDKLRQINNISDILLLKRI